MAVGLDGSVLSGADDGAVRRLRPGTDHAELLYRHEGEVWTLVVDENTNVLLSGGEDANLRLFRLSIGDFLMLLTPSPIRSASCSLKHNRIAILVDDRLVLVRVEPNVEALLSWPGSGKNPPPAASSE